MAVAIIICVVLLIYWLVATVVLRLTTRMVAGITPTFSSATGAIVASLILSAIIAGITSAFDMGRSGLRLPLSIVGMLVQTMIFAVVLKDRNDAGLSFGQGCLVIIFQIP